MSLAAQIAGAIFVALVIIVATVGWCRATWRNRIKYPATEEEEPFGEANTYRRER